MPFMTMDHATDPKDDLFSSLGDLSQLEVFNNHILCAIYIRPTKTKAGLLLPEQYADEDKYQGKVGLIIKMGPTACKDPTGQWFKDEDLKVGDWIVYRPSDGWSMGVNNVDCRMLEDTNVRARISRPDFVW